MSNQKDTPQLLSWRGHKVYRCRLCSFDTTDRVRFEDHFRKAHAPLQVIEGRKKKADTNESPDLHKMTREELNSYAGWAGVTTDAEDFANKADLIAAIEAAQKGED